MPTKQKRQPRHWKLARAGTGLMFSRGMKPEPWPQWLPKTWVNIQLVQEDPIETRDEHFLSRDEWWGVVDTVLYQTEREAKKILQEDLSSFKKKVLLPEGHVSLEDILSKKNYFNFLTEHDFWDLFGYQTLTPKQANAITALRSIAVIRSEFFASDSNGFYYPYRDADQTTARMLLEMMLLTFAAIRLDLWENLRPKIEQVAKEQGRLKQISSAGVEKRKERLAKVRALSRELASQSRRNSIHGRALFVKKQWPEGPLRCPSLTSIQNYIR